MAPRRFRWRSGFALPSFGSGGAWKGTCLGVCGLAVCLTLSRASSRRFLSASPSATSLIGSRQPDEADGADCGSGAISGSDQPGGFRRLSALPLASGSEQTLRPAGGLPNQEAAALRVVSRRPEPLAVALPSSGMANSASPSSSRSSWNMSCRVCTASSLAAFRAPQQGMLVRVLMQSSSSGEFMSGLGGVPCRPPPCGRL
mmetsp:Transcript_62976/g.136373  ORF Transcript_62976/g.136373 Transcript_62976/m.136373 type:complete len:201 (+) Transcript_62976:964-1566(+)